MRKIKIILIVIGILMMAGQAQSQTLSEWLRQNRTQRNYLLQQIAAASLYSDHLVRGYRIVEGGLSVVGDFQRGELDLHDAFFAGRRLPSQLLRSDSRIPQIISWQRNILSQQRSAEMLLEKSKHELGYTERRYLRGVLKRIDKAVLGDLEDLSNLMSYDMLDLDDAARLKHLQHIFEQTRDLQTFAKRFTSSINMLVLYKRKEYRQLVATLRLHQKI